MAKFSECTKTKSEGRFQTRRKIKSRWKWQIRKNIMQVEKHGRKLKKENGNEEEKNNGRWKNEEETSSVHVKHKAQENKQSGTHYPKQQQVIQHFTTCTNLKGLSVCNQSYIKQETLGSKRVESTQQCGRMRWWLKVNCVQGSVLQAPLPYPRHLPRLDLRLSQHLPISVHLSANTEKLTLKPTLTDFSLWQIFNKPFCQASKPNDFILHDKQYKSFTTQLVFNTITTCPPHASSTCTVNICRNHSYQLIAWNKAAGILCR